MKLDRPPQPSRTLKPEQALAIETAQTKAQEAAARDKVGPPYSHLNSCPTVILKYFSWHWRDARRTRKHQ